MTVVATCAVGAGSTALAAPTPAGAPAASALTAPPIAHAAGAPNVRCMRLPAAKRAVRRAGYSVRVRGGGIFGVVVERNWRVTGQTTHGRTVTLFVSRQC